MFLPSSVFISNTSTMLPWRFHFRRDVIDQQRKDNASIPYQRVFGRTCTAIKQFLRIFIGETQSRSRECLYRENYNSYPCGWREVQSAKRVRRIEWNASRRGKCLGRPSEERGREKEREREKRRKDKRKQRQIKVSVENGKEEEQEGRTT